MGDISIRAAEPHDLQHLERGLIALQEYENALHEPQLPAVDTATPYLTWMLSQVERREGRCFVAYLGDTFIGFIAGWIERQENPAETEDSTTFGYISDICLLPSWRQKGFSRALLQRMDSYFASRKITRLRISSLAANKQAMSAYAAFGFQPYEVTLEKVIDPSPVI